MVPYRCAPKRATDNSSHASPPRKRGHLLSLPLNFDWPFDVLRPIDTVPVQGQSSVGLADSSLLSWSPEPECKRNKYFHGERNGQRQREGPRQPLTVSITTDEVCKQSRNIIHVNKVMSPS